MKSNKGLVAAIENQEALAESSELQDARNEALDHYLGKPYGNEVDGRSQVIMRDVADTIEWIKPSLMKIFASGDEVCKFEPTGPEDVEQAEQETEYCNHVLMQKNNGFLVLYDWFHDALLQRNGYVFVQFETEKKPARESYRGLSDDEMALLMQGEPEVLEHTAYPGPLGMAHDVVVRMVRETGRVVVSNIAPERVLIAADWPDVDLQGCPFVEVICHHTISELRQMGYDVDDNISDSSSGRDDEEDLHRAIDLGDNADRDLEADPATRRVKTRYVWMNYDSDGDGIAELRKVIIVGTTILEDEETDITPVASLVPTRLPHEHNGLSIDDVVQDLQEIRTALTRGFLDNMYLANNGRFAIDANVVNLDDMLTSRPGGVVRVNGPAGQAITPLLHPQEGGAILSAIEYVDTIRENRTGVTKYNQGIDADSLNKTAHGISQIMTASAQRIELIARLFAETGVRALFLLIHAVSVANGRKEEMVKLRNGWVPVDPRSWKTRRDVSVSVGLGNGNKDQMLSHLMMILQAQKEALMIGVTEPSKIYNSLSKLTMNAGFKNPDEFWTDPSKKPPQPPPPSPDAIKAEADVKKTEMSMQADAQKFQAQAQIDQQSEQMKMAAERQKFIAEAQLERERMAAEAIEKEKDRELQLRIAQMAEETKLRIAMVADDAKRSIAAGQQENQRMSDAESKGEKPDQIAALESTIKALIEHLDSPSEVIRDKAGRAEAVKKGGIVRKVARGPDGRIAGLH